MADRRTDIAEAGIRLIARRGVRELTHRAIDTELGLSPGSTSYYARTRQALIECIVDRLATRTSTDLDASPVRTISDSETAAQALGQLVDHMATSRPDDHAARFALLLELRNDGRLHALLSTESPIRQALLAGATGLLTQLGVRDPGDHAPNLVAVVDGILFDRVAGSGAADAPRVLAAFLSGLPRNA